MSKQLSIRLDDEVFRQLDEEARPRGIGLATYLRDLATAQAREIRRARIREQTRRVAERDRTDSDVRDVYDAWGTPDARVIESP